MLRLIASAVIGYVAGTKLVDTVIDSKVASATQSGLGSILGSSVVGVLANAKAADYYWPARIGVGVGTYLVLGVIL